LKLLPGVLLTDKIILRVSDPSNRPFSHRPSEIA
jgi:hypothetical protein